MLDTVLCNEPSETAPIKLSFSDNSVLMTINLWSVPDAFSGTVLSSGLHVASDMATAPHGGQ